MTAGSHTITASYGGDTNFNNSTGSLTGNPQVVNKANSATALVSAAREAGCEVVDGLEALVRQGAASFELWTGVPAPVDVMRAAVRSA